MLVIMMNARTEKQKSISGAEKLEIKVIINFKLINPYIRQHNKIKQFFALTANKTELLVYIHIQLNK